MDLPPAPDLVRAALAEQTLALAAEAATLTATDLARPSGLPGWTRGHVLAHVRLNAEAFVTVLDAASRGEVASMYPGRPKRDADIEAAATDLGTTWRIRAGVGIAAAVSGTAAALAGWLTGRAEGSGLTASGPLPALPAFA